MKKRSIRVYRLFFGFVGFVMLFYFFLGVILGEIGNKFGTAFMWLVFSIFLLGFGYDELSLILK